MICKRSLFSLLQVALTFACLSVNPSWAQTEKVLYRFQGGTVDGQNPWSPLTIGSDGNLYGVTPYGGGGGRCAPGDQLFYCGTIFQLVSSANGTWSENVLYRFVGKADGGEPSSVLVPDGSGNFFSTTLYGGAVATCAIGEGCGVVFELSPNASGWSQSAVYAFDWGAGNLPRGVVFDSSGNLYGSTLDTVFELKPKKAGGWSQLTLYEFGDSAYTAGPVARDPSGNLYGTTNGASTNEIFELSPGASGWTQAIIGTGGNIYGGPNMDSADNLYVTDEAPPGYGHILELTPTANGWEDSVVYEFHGPPDGWAPMGSLAFDNQGNIYGTTEFGGTGNCKNPGGLLVGCGTVFKISTSGSGWTESVLYSFPGGPEGYFPEGGVVLDSKGNIYGTTMAGGNSACKGRGEVPGNGCVVVFEVTP